MPSRESSPDGEHEVDFAAQQLEKLAAIELEFEQAEVEILKKQTELLAPIYERRAEVTNGIPSFWPRALANFSDLDTAITEPDAHILEECLASIDVKRPDPKEIRSFDIIFKFKENEFFSNTELKKSFVYKELGTESRGIVSEPVKIDWKEGKDVTNGATTAAYDYYHAKVKELKEKGLGVSEIQEPDWESFIPESEGGGCGGHGSDDGHDHDHDHDHDGPQRSFFNWFSWWGSGIVFEKLKAAMEKVKESNDTEGEIEIDDDDEDVYPGGEIVSQSIVKDLFPNASKFFTESIYGDGFDDDMEGLSDFDDEEGSDDEEEPPKLVEKKRKADSAAEKTDKKKKKA